MLNFRTRLVFGAAWLLFWLLLVTVAVQDYLRGSGTAVWQPVLWESSSALVATALLLLQRRCTRAHDHLLTTPQRWFFAQLPWIPLNCIAFVPLVFGIRHGVYALLGLDYEHQPWPRLFVYEALKVSLLFGTAQVVLFGVLSYRALVEERERAAQANRLLRQAQLQRLTQQMQPHFLFNALNTVSELMHTDVERADATLIQLADVLRATLDLSDEHERSLADELQLLRAYARLMAERFADRVRIDWRIDDAALACRVPVMSLQPLLENIFKHTVEKSSRCTHIVVSAARDGAGLLLRLEDDGGRLDPDAGGGIGLGNLRARLDALYGGAASLTLSQSAPAGVRAELRLPCVL